MLGIRACPVNWPIGDGDFQGVYHRDTKMVELYFSATMGAPGQRLEISIDDPPLGAC